MPVMVGRFSDILVIRGTMNSNQDDEPPRNLLDDDELVRMTEARYLEVKRTVDEISMARNWRGIEARLNSERLSHSAQGASLQPTSRPTARSRRGWLQGAVAAGLVVVAGATLWRRGDDARIVKGGMEALQLEIHASYVTAQWQVLPVPPNTAIPVRPVEIIVTLGRVQPVTAQIHFKLLKGVDALAPEVVGNQMLEQPKPGGVLHQSIITSKAPIKQMKLCGVAAETAAQLEQKIVIISSMWATYKDPGCLLIAFDDKLEVQTETPTNVPEPMSPPKLYPVPDAPPPGPPN